MSDDAPGKKCPAGLPAWVMTFADLMSLLMCFFVLLLSFSEMDVNKYKQIAGSLKEAFGVQKVERVKGIPRGINVIAREFSPGRPDPTPLKVIFQHTRQNLLDYLQLDKEKGNQKDEKELRQRDPHEEARKKRFEQAALKIEAALKEEIKKGAVEIERAGDRVVIRIREHASFASGKADLKPEIVPILKRIGRILRETNGKIVVAGHTDNIPIRTRRFRSNWELSAARAVSVVHTLQYSANLDPRRFAVEGRGDTQPLAPNDSPGNRARNRRVEIIVVQETEADEKAAKARKEQPKVFSAEEGDVDDFEREVLLPQSGVEPEFQSLQESLSNSDLELRWEDNPPGYGL